MKDDLIGRLRVLAATCPDISSSDALDIAEAADEIERLRARVAELEATVNEMAGV